MDKNLPSKSGYTGPIPGLRRFHMSWNNYSHEPQLLNLCLRACLLQLLSPHTATTEAWAPRAPVPQQEKPLQGQAHALRQNVTPHSPVQIDEMLCKAMKTQHQIRSDQISLSDVSDSLQPHESQHARPPCPTPTPRVHSDSGLSCQ